MHDTKLQLEGYLLTTAENLYCMTEHSMAYSELHMAILRPSAALSETLRIPRLLARQHRCDDPFGGGYAT